MKNLKNTITLSLLLTMASCSGDRPTKQFQKSVNHDCTSATNSNLSAGVRINHKGHGELKLFDKSLDLPNQEYKTLMHVKGTFNNQAAVEFVSNYCNTGNVPPTEGLLQEGKRAKRYERIAQDNSKGAMLSSARRNTYSYAFSEFENNKQTVLAKGKQSSATMTTDDIDNYIETGALPKFEIK